MKSGKRRAMIKQDHLDLSIAQKCKLGRSTGNPPEIQGCLKVEFS